MPARHLVFFLDDNFKVELAISISTVYEATIKFTIREDGEIISTGVVIAPLKMKPMY